MLTITTTYRTDARGAGKVTAKGGGRQRTLAYDQAASADRNHGSAAGELAKVLGLKWSEHIVHMSFNDGTHKFNFPVWTQ